MTLFDFYEALYLKDSQQLNVVLVDVDMKSSRPLEPTPATYDDLIPYFDNEVLHIGFENNIVTVSIEYYNPMMSSKSCE